jgi:uncharacterized phage protein gp47/JayE
MPFPRPSLDTIRDRVKGDLRTATGVKAIVRRSFLDVLSKAIAGVSHVLHGHIFHVSKQVFIDQAESEFLDRWGAIYAIERNSATFAEFNITVTGTNTTVIPVDQIWVRDDGLKYLVKTQATISGGTATVALIAEEAGTAYNLNVAETITIESPTAGIDSDALVASISISAVDVEVDSSYRDRIIARIQEPPSGGTVTDYKNWALDVSGVTRVWIAPEGYGIGTVVIYFVTDGTDPIIPTAPKIAEVLAAIEALQPITARAFVFAPTSTPLNLNIDIKPNTVEVQNAIKAEIQAMLTRESHVRGTYKTASETYDGIIELSKIREAISIATGEEDHVLNAPVANLQPALGGIVTIGTYTFGTLA